MKNHYARHLQNDLVVIKKIDLQSFTVSHVLPKKPVVGLSIWLEQAISRHMVPMAQDYQYVRSDGEIVYLLHGYKWVRARGLVLGIRFNG